jgi:hypothetical protein
LKFKEIYMSLRNITVGLAALVLAVPAAAQNAVQDGVGSMHRGTMEIGAFASGARFEQALSLNLGYGGGGRIGMFLDRRWSVEFEDAEMRASRPGGLRDANVGILSGRLVASDFRRGAFTFIGGAGGGVSTETSFLHSYGFDLLAGVKIATGQNAALRIDFVNDFLANNGWKTYQSVRIGMSWFRHPVK